MEQHHILIIEDESSIANTIATILELHGFRYTCAPDGHSAISLIRSKSFDLILCDINLPDTDGYEILREVRGSKDTVKTPFIFLTAFAAEDEVRNGINMGADDYITKPFAMKTLVEAITHRIERHKRESALMRDELSVHWLNTMANNFSHEFLTPINGILSSAYLLEQLLPPEKMEELREMILAIKHAGYRMQRNTRKLLTYSLLNLRESEISNTAHIGSYNTYQLLQEVVELHRNLGSATPEKLQITGEPHPTLKGNPDYFKMILEELVDNALKFNSGNNPAVINLAQDARTLSISFTNHVNHPISFTQDNIGPFRKFHKDDSGEGLGLGLYLSKMLCPLYSYKLDILSDDTKVCVTLTYFFSQ